MNDPTRWRDEPSGPTQMLLRGARRPQAPGAHELERLGAAVDAIARAPVAPSPSWVRLGIAGVIAFLIVGGGTFVWALHARDVKRRAAADAIRAQITRAQTERALAEAPAPPKLQPPPEPAARNGRPGRRHAVETKLAAATPAAPVEAAARPTDTLAREVPLIDAGRSELATAPSRALASLEMHRREFPHGQLAAEREFLAVQALLQMNHLADAKKRAQELAAHYPASSYAARAERLIEDAEAQRAAVPTHDSSRGSDRPGQQRAQDRL
jgi:hypothetical protein